MSDSVVDEAGNAGDAIGQDSYRFSHMDPDHARAYADAYVLPGSAKEMNWAHERVLLDRILAGHAAASRSAVDFACGTGRILAYLQRKIPAVYGIDISPAMLEIARVNAPEAILMLNDVTSAEQIVFEQPVDVITAFRFFLNAEPSLQRAVLNWMRGALAPDGVLVANFHCNPRSLRGSYLQMRNVDGLMMLSPRDARDLLKAEGFEVRAMYGYDYLPYRRQGDHMALPGVRRRIERSMLSSKRTLGIAGSFIVVAHPVGR